MSDGPPFGSPCERRASGDHHQRRQGDRDSLETLTNGDGHTFLYPRRADIVGHINIAQRIVTFVVLSGVCAAVPQCGSELPPVGPSSPVSTTTPRTTNTPPPPRPPTLAPAAVHSVTAAELGASWRPGCPVGPNLLRRVEVNYLGFDGQTHRGELIVHRGRRRRCDRDPRAALRAGLSDREDAQRRRLSRRRGRAVDAGQQHLGIQLSSAAGVEHALDARLRPGHRRQSAHQSVHRQRRQHRADDRRAVPRPHAAPTPACCMRAIRPCVPSPTAVGAGAVTGAVRRTTSTSNGNEFVV